MPPAPILPADLAPALRDIAGRQHVRTLQWVRETIVKMIAETSYNHLGPRAEVLGALMQKLGIDEPFGPDPTETHNADPNEPDEETAYDAADPLTALREENAKLKADVADLERVFELRLDADRRAIDRWAKDHPDKPNTWPDLADMVTFLMKRLEDLEQAIDDVRDRLSRP